MNVQELLKEKMMEIQSRLPIPMNGISGFSDALKSASDEISANTLIKDSTIQLDPDKISESFLNKVFRSSSLGSYEADYPLLSQAEIQKLMPRIDAAINNASNEYGVDKNLIRAVVKTESSFQPLALSTSGAQGLMQLMPDTSKWLNVTDPYNIEQNIMGGTQYLRDQLYAFNGDLQLALAAYNAGPNAVKEYGGIPPFDQPQNYVKKALEYYQMYRQLK